LSERLKQNAENIHKTLKKEFLKDLSFKEDGNIIKKSTSNLSTVEMEEYLSKIRVWASKKHRIFIPEPNENNFY